MPKYIVEISKPQYLMYPTYSHISDITKMHQHVIDTSTSRDIDKIPIKSKLMLEMLFRFLHLENSLVDLFYQLKQMQKISF